MKLLDEIKSSDGTLIQAAGEVPFRVLAERDWRRFEFGSRCKILLWTDSVEQIVINLAAANASGADALVAHRSLAEAEILCLIERTGSTHLVRDECLEVHQQSTTSHLGEGSISVMTSGTTRAPKIARHTADTLFGTIHRTANSGASRWMLTYPPTSFAGLQVIFSAALGGGDLVVPANRTFVSFAETVRTHRVTHVSGTPTFWRGLLMGLGAGDALPLQQITIGGEAVDQPTLDRLQARFPQARVTHMYASTEAGVGFSVLDGRAGLPAKWLNTGVNGADLRVLNGVLQIRSPRALQQYESGEQAPIDATGWLDTGDLVREEGDRLMFIGRSDRRCNIGGFKVSPEEVEASLMQCEGVADLYVSTVLSPISGQVLCASVVPERGRDLAEVRLAVERFAYQKLERHKIPRIIRLVDSINTAGSGKKLR